MSEPSMDRTALIEAFAKQQHLRKRKWVTGLDPWDEQDPSVRQSGLEQAAQDLEALEATGAVVMASRTPESERTQEIINAAWELLQAVKFLHTEGVAERRLEAAKRRVRRYCLMHREAGNALPQAYLDVSDGTNEAFDAF